MIVAGIAVLVYLGIAVYRNAQKVELIAITLVDTGWDIDNQTAHLENDLLELLGTGDSHEEVTIDTNASSGTDYADVIKMTVLLSEDVTDILFCSRQLYDENKGHGIFKDWKNILGDDYEKYAPYIVDGAISLADSKKWKDYRLVEYDPVYMVVLESSDKDEEAKQLAEFFLKE